MWVGFGIIWGPIFPPELLGVDMTEHTKPVKTPSNWAPDGMSKGKQSGPVRQSPDASRPKK